MTRKSSSLEADLQAAALMAEMDRAYIAEDEEKFLSLNDKLFDISAECSLEFERLIARVSETESWKSTWDEVQVEVLSWIKRNKALLIKHLTNLKNDNAAKDLMNLIWVFLDAMGNPKYAGILNADTSDGFWGLFKKNEHLDALLPKFVLAYYYLEYKKEPSRSKSDIDFFYMSLPSTYRPPQPPAPDFFGEFRGGFLLYLEDYFYSDEPSWPIGWPSAEACVRQTLAQIKHFS